MQRNILAVMALISIAAMGMLNAASALSSEESGNGMDEPVLSVMQAGEQLSKSDMGNLTLRGWNNFVENFDYAGEVLNSTVNGNMSYRDATIAMTAIFILNSQALLETEKLNPDDTYADFHEYTLDAMKYFNVYLVNMAKLFQTQDRRYAESARDGFNITMEYYKKGKDEAEFLF